MAAALFEQSSHEPLPLRPRRRQAADELPGPLVTPPAGLWQPASGITPSTGNYVYLESRGGDYVGAGANYLYTQANATLSVNAPLTHLAVSVNGDKQWNGDFQAMNSLSRLQVGYCGDAQRYAFGNPVKGHSAGRATGAAATP